MNEDRKEWLASLRPGDWVIVGVVRKVAELGVGGDMYLQGGGLFCNGSRTKDGLTATLLPAPEWARTEGARCELRDDTLAKLDYALENKFQGLRGFSDETLARLLAALPSEKTSDTE